MEDTPVGKMPNHIRAKIFLPFDSLSSFHAALKEAEIKKDEPIIVLEEKAQEIDEILHLIHPGMRIEVTYFNKEDERYHTVDEVVTKIDNYLRVIFTINHRILFKNIRNIEIKECF